MAAVAAAAAALSGSIASLRAKRSRANCDESLTAGSSSQGFHAAVIFDISCAADKEIKYRRERGREGERSDGGGVLKLQKDTHTREITGEFSGGK